VSAELEKLIESWVNFHVPTEHVGQRPRTLFQDVRKCRPGDVWQGPGTGAARTADPGCQRTLPGSRIQLIQSILGIGGSSWSQEPSDSWVRQGSLGTSNSTNSAL
jgi:hypothetical protein